VDRNVAVTTGVVADARRWLPVQSAVTSMVMVGESTSSATVRAATVEPDRRDRDGDNDVAGDDRTGIRSR